MRTLDDVYRSMEHIQPNEYRIKDIEAIREAYKAVAASVMFYCSNQRAASIALTELETSLMWAIKSIVLEEESK
jgi:hypothetical protein